MNRKMLIIVSLILASAIVSCGSKDTKSLADVKWSVTSNITTDTWTSTGTYTINSSIYVSGTLTIQPGTVVKFGPYGALIGSTGSQINATGTSASKIVFTSYRDSSVGGTLVSGTPAAKDWMAVEADGNSSTFSFCEFRYSTVGLEIDGNSGTVTNCTFVNNDTGLDASSAGTSFTMNNDTFYSNNFPLYINGSFSVDTTNLFHDPLNVATKNTNQYISINDNITTNVTWSNKEVPYCFDGTQSTYYVSSTFAINSGVTVKFSAGARLIVSTGKTLTAVGTPTEAVVFTSMKEGTGTPVIKDWVGLEIDGNSSSLQYCQIRYADTGLYIVANNVSVKNTIFTYNNIGLDVTNAGTGAFTLVSTSNTFYLNTHPLQINGSVSVDSSNAFVNPAATTVKNTYQAIEVYSNTASGVAWNNTVPFVFTGTSGTFYVNGTLTLGSGVILKFDANVTLDISVGGSIAGFTTATFTSYKDDVYGGDSNGDGSASTAASGDWNGILDENTSLYKTGSNIHWNAN